MKIFIKQLNQTPDQLARDKIDAILEASGWTAQPKKDLNLAAGVGVGVAVREYHTDLGPADYVLCHDAVKENSFKIGDIIRILILLPILIQKQCTFIRRVPCKQKKYLNGI